MSQLHRKQFNRRLWEQARRDERLWPFKSRQQNLKELRERRVIFKKMVQKEPEHWDVDSITMDELRDRLSDQLLSPRAYLLAHGVPKKKPRNPICLADLEPACWYEFFVRGSLSQIAYISRDHDVEIQNGNYTTFDFLYALRNGTVKKLGIVATYEKGVLDE